MATSRKQRTGDQRSKPQGMQAVIEWFKSIFIGVIIFLVLRTFIIQTFTIISGSMENTLLVGDFLVVNKVAYGAVIPTTEKRLPGYTRPKHDDNGQLLDEPYVKRTDPLADGTDPRMLWQRQFVTDSAAAQPYRPTRDNWGPIVVPANRYFRLGDNRDESLDSRFWGFVQAHDVKGKASVLYFSWNGRERGLSKVRWSRIGDLL